MNLLSALVLTLSGSIVGQWQFYKMKYLGNEFPPRDPNLVLKYTFEAEGSSQLFWTYKNDPKVVCHRRGTYSLEDNVLRDEVTWVDPNNHFTCSNDPDMQLGNIANAPIEFLENGDMTLEIPFNEDVLYYIWRPTE